MLLEKKNMVHVIDFRFLWYCFLAGLLDDDGTINNAKTIDLIKGIASVYVEAGIIMFLVGSWLHSYMVISWLFLVRRQYINSCIYHCS